ncbi:hypothetical protein [Pontibacter mangrovi]|uniref:DUF304 domain-containing protein n=1 Tax=Pontibacter mangrovi TaxID=2589816 RepID=A0A501W1F5_9BACT|nr:hypothetical protein [Pontibacter mangrovi]TPE39466.1 hypothetical protein FJM65_21010 [Pontibacter mangrovi]
MNAPTLPEPLYINLLSQYSQPHRARWIYLTLAILVPVSYFTLLLFEFSWLNLVMGTVFTVNAYVIYASSSEKDPLGVLGKSYLRLNEQGLKYKARRQRAVEVLWQEVRLMQLHLFSVDFELKNGQLKSINLEQLSDENLQLVKVRLRQVQAEL